MSEPTYFDGFYAIYYHGNAGPGLAQMQLIDGKIIGADVTGGLWDGEFAVDSITENIICEITIRLPPGVPLATTGKPPVGNEAARMKFKLPLDFATREYVSLDLPIGKVNVRFQKVR
jgi:hypothetical protein